MVNYGYLLQTVLEISWFTTETVIYHYYATHTNGKHAEWSQIQSGTLLWGSLFRGIHRALLNGSAMKWKEFHQPWLVICTFHRQGCCSRGGHLCNEHSEEKYSCSYKWNSTTEILIRFCVDKLYECILILMGLGGAFMTSLQQLKRFEARISLFKSLDCPLALAVAGRNQRFTRHPPVINHNQGLCNWYGQMDECIEVWQ